MRAWDLRRRAGAVSDGRGRAQHQRNTRIEARKRSMRPNARSCSRPDTKRERVPTARPKPLRPHPPSRAACPLPASDQRTALLLFASRRPCIRLRRQHRRRVLRRRRRAGSVDVHSTLHPRRTRATARVPSYSPLSLSPPPAHSSRLAEILAWISSPTPSPQQPGRPRSRATQCEHALWRRRPRPVTHRALPAAPAQRQEKNKQVIVKTRLCPINRGKTWETFDQRESCGRQRWKSLRPRRPGTPVPWRRSNGATMRKGTWRTSTRAPQPRRLRAQRPL